MEFREAASLLQGASAEAHSIDLGSGFVELVLAKPARHTLRFEKISHLKWTGPDSRSASLDFSVVGLEKLGPSESWRLYARTPEGAELELTCASVSCDGMEVTGVGRAYRH